MEDRDVRLIRFIGVLAAGVGFVLLLFTTLITLLALFSGGPANLGAYAHGALALILAFIMACSLISCGAQIQRIKLSAISIENLRLTWTALVLMMTLSLAAGLWLSQPLAFVAAFMLLALLSIRGAIIRLSRY